MLKSRFDQNKTKVFFETYIGKFCQMESILVVDSNPRYLTDRL